MRFEILGHTDRVHPAAEPIVAMEGGPGLTSITSLSAYAFMLGPLIAHHDLIVFDQRGTGVSSAIDCPELQERSGVNAPGAYAAAAGRCGELLGVRADAYGSDAVGDDLAAILEALHVPKIDLYGDSYGSYAAQVFTLHHPALVRTLVLDGTYDNQIDPLEREESAALRTAWVTLCERSSCPESSILGAIGEFSEHLEREPLTITAANGEPMMLDAPFFAQLVNDATYSYAIFRDLPAALVAAASRNFMPLARLVQETKESLQSGSFRGDSIGDQEAVECHDYPKLWDQTASPLLREAKLQATVEALPAGTFAPFSNGVWLQSPYENQFVTGCLQWPLSTIEDPPFPSTVAHPNTPVLILDGEFDQATPVADALQVAHAWPSSTFVEVANSGHVTGLNDSLHCTSTLIQRFVATARVGETRCASSIPPVWVLPKFPTALSQAPSVAPGSSAGQAGWVAAAMVGDALARWWASEGVSRGRGLYGGSYTVESGPTEEIPVAPAFTFNLHGSRFVPDASVSGTATWHRGPQRVDADLSIAGPNGHLGRFHITWSTSASAARAAVKGDYAGERVDGTMPAPWSVSP